MSYLTYNGKLITSNNKYVIQALGPAPIVELFSFKTIGTNLYNLMVTGAEASTGDSISWDLGDTSTSVNGFEAVIYHTYSGGYVYPADKLGKLSMRNPNHVDFLQFGGPSDSNSRIYDINISNWPSLTSLNLGANDVSTLSLTSNINLQYLSVYNNPIPSINIENNLNMIYMYIIDCSLLKSVVFHNSSNYPGFYGINAQNSSMNAVDVSNFIDNVYNHRAQLTYPSGWGINLSGRNASINTVDAQKIVRMEKYNGAATWVSNYNVPNGIMRNYFMMGYLDSNIASYFMQQTDNGINKAAFYGNSMTPADSSLVITFRYSLDTSISNFQASDVTWNLVTRYKRDSGDAYTTLDNTNFVCTSNTSGMTFQKDVSLYLSHVLGSKQFGIQFQITLTDNRANKNQVAGDTMILRATPMLNDNPMTETIVVGGNESSDSYYSNFIRDFIRTKWGA